MSGELTLTWAESESFAMDNVEQAEKELLAKSELRAENNSQRQGDGRIYQNGISSQLQTIIDKSHESGELCDEMKSYADFAFSLRSPSQG